MPQPHWDPFRDWARLQGRIHDALSEGAEWFRRGASSGAWSPPVDIFARENELVLRAELPGVPREKIDVRVEENTLILAGERLPDELDEGESYRRERVFGGFSRRFGLPTTVEATRITARYVDGILEVRLPRAERDRGRRIVVDEG